MSGARLRDMIRCVTQIFSSRFRELHRIKKSMMVAVAAGVFGVLAISSTRETLRESKVNEDIQRLEKQVAELEGRRLRLAETLQQVQTPERLDREARLRLGMQKPGERVFILRDASSTEGSWSSETAWDVREAAVASSSAGNPQKWFTYFFGKE